MDQTDNSTNNMPDMSDEEFRKIGYELIDWIIDYRKSISSLRVVPETQPGDITGSLPDHPPQKGESFESILSDFREKIVPGVTHWNHPRFLAYFNSTSSAPGIFAELLSAALNVNGMLWKTGPAVTELESVTLKWLREMLGLEPDFWGIIYDTASTSSMHAIAAAREQKSDLMIREKGMSGRPELPRLKLYCSEEAHSSIEKAVITLGLGKNSVCRIPTDEQFRMIPDALSNAIESDRQKGELPFCVVATIGTTSATSIDPVTEIADICKKENCWLHVDAAHAGIAAIPDEMKWILDGANHADSIVINPHKWMFTPVDLSVLYVKNPDILKRTFSLVPDYLKTSTGDAVNLMDYGMQLGRRFRALKLWFIIRYFGVEGLSERIRGHFRLAAIFRKKIDSSSDFEILAPSPLTTICFRYNPGKSNDENELSDLNAKLLENVNKTGEVFISGSVLKGKFILRCSVSGLFTGEADIIKAIDVIKSEAEKLK